MTDSSILLTGGTGFFGRSLLRYMLKNSFLSSHNLSVTVLSRTPHFFLRQYPEFSSHARLNFCSGDILVPETLPKNQTFTHILHAATDSTHGAKLTPRRRFNQILDGTRNLLDFAVMARARRFLLTSSGAVYGPQPPDVDALGEDWLGSPAIEDSDNAYGLGKRAAEHLCALYAQEYGFETVIARCFAFSGPDLPLDVHFAIGNFIRDALMADAISVNGNGTPIRSYLDQEDLARWLHVLLLEGRGGETYNVGSDEAVSIAELAHLVRDLVAPEKPVRILGRGQNTQGRNRYVPDINKARRELGLEVSISLAESIRRTAESHRKSIHALRQ